MFDPELYETARRLLGELERQGLKLATRRVVPADSLLRC